MIGRYVHLRSFPSHELLFDEVETRDILKFVFRHQEIAVDSLEVTERVRGFAQGLLVEAVDATCALGYLKILLDSYCNPGGTMKNILMKFGRRALHHWFVNAKPGDLMSAKISEAIRLQLARNFASDLGGFLNGTAANFTIPGMHFAYIQVEHSSYPDRIWG